MGDISVYVPSGRAVKGGGLFSILAGLAKRAVPFLMRTIIPEGLNLAQNIVGDINSGTLNRSNLKKRGLESLHNVGRRIVKGGRRKRTTKKKRTVNRKKKLGLRKKRKYNDVFMDL
ncbi:MAG TPA: hypothetical protein EYG76_01315 [Methanothermococcus okinawensis]|uniref:Uncharacterized protein n=1 Tax=Methanothermococcus okinawensis TaxID=155863 RepID=A0A833DRQ4_9EURY|nr:hypothetical protein [Methanothermococcus okinawensis]